MALLERGSFLAALDGYLGDAVAGSGRIVLVGGEAGIGKTSLLRAFQSSRPDLPWLTSACDGSFTPQPLGPLFEIAHQLGGPLLAAVASADRRAVFAAFLDEIDRRAPVVVVVEDVHWADDATLDWLRFLARRLVGRRALLVVSYRDDEPGPLRTTLADLAMHAGVRRMTLPPLSELAVRQLAGREDVAELYRLTGGVPFYVGELLGSGPGTVPPTVADLVAARTAALSSGARQLLEAAAVLASPAGGDVLTGVAGSGADSLDECVRSGTLVPTGSGYVFRHDIIRLAVAAQLGPSRSAALHRRALATLEIVGADVAQLAHHAEGAADASRVLRYATAAARGAFALRSNREAVAQYERALRHAGGLEPAERALLHEELAAAYWRLDRWADADIARERALAIRRELGDRDKISENLTWLSRGWWHEARIAESLAAGEESLALMRAAEDCDARAWAFAANGAIASDTLGHDAAIELCVEAARTARAVGNTEVAAMALAMKGVLLLNLDRSGWSDLEHALELAQAGDHEDPATFAFRELYGAATERFRMAEYQWCYDAGLAFSLDHDMDTVVLRGIHAGALVRLGRLREAVALGEQCLRESRSTRTAMHVSITLARALGRQGDPRCFDVLGHVAEVRDGEWAARLAAVRAELAWLYGEPQPVPAALAEPGIDVWVRGELVLWLHRLGRWTGDADDLPEPYRAELAGNFAAASAWWASAGCPYEAAMSLLGSGTPDALRQGLDAFTSLGAAGAAAQVRRRLRQLGATGVPAGPHRATRRHPYGLTSRQSEVLDLLRRGMSNAAISQQLVISERTAEHHVAAVLAKLGVASRADLQNES